MSMLQIKVKLNMNRKDKALYILKTYKNQVYDYLGMGSSGVVFHDDKWVYKVYISDKYEIDIGILYFIKSQLSLFIDSKYLYEIHEVIENIDSSILIYPYEKSIIVESISEEEYIFFLAELWEKRLILRDIKNENFIRTETGLKLIDYEFEGYNDNLFLNMCVRAYLNVKNNDINPSLKKKIARSAINNFDLPELEGVQGFVSKVFTQIMYSQSRLSLDSIENLELKSRDKTSIVSYDDLDNLETLFYNQITNGFYLQGLGIDDVSICNSNYFKPKEVSLHYTKILSFRANVSLLIKTCAQDVKTIEANVRHIIKQLSSPNCFYERVVSIDPKEFDFLREYNTSGKLGDLIIICKRLVKENVIDRYIICNEAASIVNKRWFNIECNNSHSIKNAPVTSQLYALEKCKGDYILQMDSDVIIVRKDYSHSFLEDMLSAIEQDNRVVSVGFNICKSDEDYYIEYHGFENGGFVPEVRMGLFSKSRLLAARPLYNTVKDGFLSLSWFRSLHETQKQKGLCSLRGGDNRSFYIHPQNYRKKQEDSWMTILDKAEQNIIPSLQINEFDLAGSYHDWCLDKRHEDLVVVCVMRNVEYSRFLRMWTTLLSQSYKEWGLVLIDDASTNGLPIFVENIISLQKEKVSFVKNRHRNGGMHNTYKAIHHYIDNPNAIIVTVDGDDALIGKDVLKTLYSKFTNDKADVVIGRMYQTYRLQAHYRYPVDFINPRKVGGNVWQHIRSFKKYLFDSLEKYDLQSFTKLSDKYSLKESIKLNWIQDCTDFAMMVPIIEMSSNPVMLDDICYYHERSTLNTSERRHFKEDCIADILNKKNKLPENVVYGRKKFLPNLNKIEIDITYECNLNCISCNRSCRQAPTKEFMSLEQIKKFVAESKDNEKKWELINILGGEPTLHKDFKTIIEYIVKEYILAYSHETVLQVVSNGVTDRSRQLLYEISDLENVYIDYASFKDNNKVEYFTPFNLAPIDDDRYVNEDFSCACWVTSYCGLSLNSRGYFACSVVGGMERVMNKGLYISSLNNMTHEKLDQQLNLYCRYCGNYSDYASNNGGFIARSDKAPLKSELISKSWKIIYDEYNNTK